VNSVAVALQQLQLALNAEFADTPGLQQISIAVTLSDASDALAWLTTQRLYPQFYWQQRNGDDEIAALGLVRQFNTLEAARTFLDEYADQSVRPQA